MKQRGLLFFLLGLGLTAALGWFAFPYALYQKVEQPLQFSHKVHMGEKAGMSCEDCHSLNEQDGSFAGIPKVENCANCHSEAQGETQAEKVLVERYVQPNKEIPWGVYARQPDNVYFPHVRHVKVAKIECKRCHGPHGESSSLRPLELNRVSGYSRDIWGRSISGIASAPWDGMKMDDCIRCHQDKGVTDSCMVCHK